MGLKENYGVNYLFSTVNEYYRISIETEVGAVKARLEGLVHVPRDETARTANGPEEVLWVSQR